MVVGVMVFVAVVVSCGCDGDGCGGGGSSGGSGVCECVNMGRHKDKFGLLKHTSNFNITKMTSSICWDAI